MSLKTFRKIDKGYGPPKINAVGTKDAGASESALIPEMAV
jgi:hypothetical protein